MALIEVRQHGWIRGIRLDQRRRQIICINQTEQQMNIWRADRGDRSSKIWIYQWTSDVRGIDNRMAGSRTEPVHFLPRDEKPPRVRRTAVPKTITARSLPV